MLNEEKVKLMTKLAIYESTKGKKQLNISRYYKRDYVRMNMFKTIISSTIAFFVILTLYVLINMEKLMLQLNDMDFMGLAVKLGISYVVFVGLYCIAAWIFYGKKYEKIKPDVIEYNRGLKTLREGYEKDDKDLQKKSGKDGVISHDDISNN